MNAWSEFIWFPDKNGATQCVSSNKASWALSQCLKGKCLSCIILYSRSAEVYSGHAGWFEFAPLPELWEHFLKSGIFGRPRKNNRKRQGYESCHASRVGGRPPSRFCCIDCKFLMVLFDLNFVDSASGYREGFTLYCMLDQPLLSLVQANTQQEFYLLHSPLTAG